MLDHGLYIDEAPAFRRQYCQLWEAMFLRDGQRGLPALPRLDENPLWGRGWGTIPSHLLGGGGDPLPLLAHQPTTVHLASCGDPNSHPVKPKFLPLKKHFFFNSRPLPTTQTGVF